MFGGYARRYKDDEGGGFGNRFGGGMAEMTRGEGLSNR